MTTIYSYCLRYDGGAAPNPFWGTCTLAICKPKIRKAAEVGDWIVGFGSKHSPIGDLSERMVYMMQVTQKMTMPGYDEYTRTSLTEKIPILSSSDPRIRKGDSIYDFTCNPPQQRKGVHKEEQRETDMSGKYVLLSTHFWYFGRNAIAVPDFMKNLIRFGRGHRSQSNAAWVDEFHEWVQNFTSEPNQLYGLPIEESYDQSKFDDSVTPCYPCLRG
jgi:hypothetical protein